MTSWTSLDVRCSECGATPGVRCRQLTDTSKQTAPHQPRRRLARETWAEQNPEHVQGQRPLWMGPGPS